jgi:hypothetical protein
VVIGLISTGEAKATEAVERASLGGNEVTTASRHERSTA